MQLFVCGAKPESEFVIEKYGHEAGVVQYTGLARYDNLHDARTKKQIVVMPTWRTYIQSKEEFLNSEYFEKWQGLLKNEELIALLEKNNFDLIFYPHYEVQKYLNCFEKGSARIKIASFDKFDVQLLLKESKLLITDYSSVFFDFGYMKKPIVYFQFDIDSFFNEIHEKGYFNHDEDGFGRVCLTIEDVVEAIQACFDNDFVLEKHYLERVERFFPLYDNKNCQRIFESIIER